MGFNTQIWIKNYFGMVWNRCLSSCISLKYYYNQIQNCSIIVWQSLTGSSLGNVVGCRSALQGVYCRGWSGLWPQPGDCVKDLLGRVSLKGQQGGSWWYTSAGNRQSLLELTQGRKVSLAVKKRVLSFVFNCFSFAWLLTKNVSKLVFLCSGENEDGQH